MIEQEQPAIISFAEFEIDVAKRRLLRNGELLQLNAKAFDLLVFLAENAGRILTKEEILEAVWSRQFVEEANLTVQISALRKALGEQRGAPKFLITVPGKGYKFVAEAKKYPADPANIYAEKAELLLVNEDLLEENGHFHPGRKSSLPGVRLKNWQLVLLALVLAGAVLIGAGYLLRQGKTNIFAETANLSLKKLTSNGSVRTTALSSNGKLFAYTMDKGNQHSLWLGNVDGGEPVMLRPPTESNFINLSFSSDGSSLFYVLTDNRQSNGALYKIAVFGGAPEKIHDNINSPIAFSTDGSQFVFTRTEKENNKAALVLANLNSANERELVIRPLTRRFAAFSPSWSPDGAMIVFGESSDEPGKLRLSTINIKDGSVRLLSPEGWNFIRSTVWLKDQSGILLIGEPKTSDDGRWQLYHISYPDGIARQFNPDLNSYGSTLSIAADGKTLLAIKEDLASQIWMAPAADLSQAKQLTFGSPAREDGWLGLDWAASGKIIYTSVGDKTKTIWTMDADGSNQNQLIPNGGENIYPSISDDNRFVVYQSNREGKIAVWRADAADGGNQQKITEDFTEEPTVSPDGHWIVYSKGEEDFGSLWRVATEGGEPLNLVKDGAGWARISPDGKFVACEYRVDGQIKLAILSIDGGVPLKLFDTAPDANFRGGVRWTPGGQAIAYRDWFSGIWLQKLDQSVPERMKGLPPEKLYSFDWSPDGKSFAFTRGSEVRDAMLIRIEK